MNTERWNAARIQEAVRKAQKPVVAWNTDGTYTNIDIARASRMVGVSYLVDEALHEIVVEMGSEQKEQS